MYTVILAFPLLIGFQLLFFRNTVLILFFKLFFFLALQLWHSFSIPSLMSYLLAGLEKDPHGDRVVTQQRQQASPYSSIHVYLWMSLTVSCVTQPCACKEQRGALPRAPTSARLCLGASMNLGLHYQHKLFTIKQVVSIKNNLFCSLAENLCAHRDSHSQKHER